MAASEMPKNEEDFEKKDEVAGSKVEGMTLDEALELTGFGWYNYLLISISGINLLSNFSCMTIFSYVIPATDCDLNLTVSQKGLLSSVMFTGMILTTHLFGHLADEYGRKYVASICNLVTGILTFLTAFCPDFVSLVSITFINGAINAGVLMQTYVYVGESTAPKYRPQAVLFCGAFGYSVGVFVPFLAILTIPLEIHWDILGFVTFSSWRLVMVLASVTPMIGSALNLFLRESPKYLLAKGRTEEMLDALKYAYKLNKGENGGEFPVVGPICLDPNEIECESGGKGSFRRIWTQTVLLFKKPLRERTIVMCVIQAGLNGACNLMFVRLAQLIASIRSYAITHPGYGVTFCEVMEEVAAFNSTAADDSLLQITSDGKCAFEVPIDIYYIAAANGLGQVCLSVASGVLARFIGNKTLLVTYLCGCVALCIAMIHNTNQLATILCMIIMTLALETSLPISFSLLVEDFPTSVRSTVSCMSLAFGRIATTLGTMLMAELQAGYCDLSYYGFSVILIALGLLSQMFVKGRTSESPEK